MDVFKGVFRDEAWAMPLLVLSVIVLCALLLYTVVCFCSWIKPTARGSTLMPWLQMPFLLGLMWLASISIVAAVPLNDAACRMLFVGPSIGYVVLLASLLSRIIQRTMRANVILHWLLVFFVVLNQMVISITYLLRSTRKNCTLTVHDQLLMMLYPALLIGVVLLLVYRTTRRTRSHWKTQQAIHIGLATTFSGAFAGCWLGAACILGDVFLSSCIGFGCLATVVVVSLILFIPKEEPMDFNSDSIRLRKGDHYDEERERQWAQNLADHKEINRSYEKTEPEIIILPVASDSKSLPDIALQALSARSHHHHRRHHHNGKLHDRDDRHHYHQQQRRPHRWHNKLCSSASLNRRMKTSKTRNENSSHALTRQVGGNFHHTPYKRRGWLY